MDKYYVYMYLHNDIPRYIGKGYGRRYRVQEHLYDNTQNIVFKRFLNKYFNDIEVKFLIENVSDEEAKYWERFYIATIGRKINNSGPLLNLSAGGEGTAGIKQRPEWIEKRQVARALHNNFKHTEETKFKIKAARAKQVFPKDFALQFIGKKASEETKKKMSESHKKRYQEGRIGYWAGKTMSEETRKKMKQQHTGSKNTGAKLNEQIVLSMRKDHDYDGLNYKQLSNKYNISITQTQRIIKRISWKNI